jgi:hypothetical protein
MSVQIALEKLLQLVKRNCGLAAAIVQIGMHRIRDDKQFLVVPDQLGKGILAEIDRPSNPDSLFSSVPRGNSPTCVFDVWQEAPTLLFPALVRSGS